MEDEGGVGSIVQNCRIGFVQYRLDSKRLCRSTDGVGTRFRNGSFSPGPGFQALTFFTSYLLSALCDRAYSQMKATLGTLFRAHSFPATSLSLGRCDPWMSPLTEGEAMHSPQGLQSLQPIPFQRSTLMPSLCVNKHTFFIHHKAT